MYYFIAILAAVIFDQAVKFAIRTNMDLHSSIAVIDGIFHITYIQNTGAAFSILSGHTYGLIMITLLITAGILTYLYKLRKSGHWLLMSSLSLIVAGGIGNIIDRLMLGYVVDFFDLRVWPIFNVADVYVCTGCVLLILYVFVIEPKLNEKKDYKNVQ
ncbi:signal peptidase II [Clostridium aminobutyricum]|uniref:Lipoprotein signal peptidase n=1 Tax=Clostridium aminobutyricum TaxID=33953 RepID=A0A939D779_CLOAM|nr:signal peptidase II [Clostridium aminobutyricum]MBN7772103.1 signal peptidase II [Clostridium aminobutyricum]